MDWLALVKNFLVKLEVAAGIGIATEEREITLVTWTVSHTTVSCQL